MARCRESTRTSGLNSSWYLTNSPQVGGSGLNPLVHFIIEGAEAGLQPHPDVDIDEYIAQHAELAGERLKAYIRFVHSDSEVAQSAAPILFPAKNPRAQTAVRNLGAHQSISLDLAEFGDTFDEADRLPDVPQAPRHGSLAVNGGIDLVSVDIWDTVLRRDCHPDEIKLQSARYLLIRAFPDLKPASRDQGLLYHARISAENASAANDEYEFRFEVAIDLWLADVLAPEASESLKAQLKAELLAHELAAEKRSTRVDQPMEQLLRSLKTPVVFASDFYMPARFIEDLLAVHGLQDHFIRGYVSSDTFDTKRSGRLFDRILSETGCEPSNVLHIGDNVHADVEIAKAKGLSIYHHLVDGESRRKDWYDTAFSAWRSQDLTYHQRRIAALIEDAASSHVKADSPGNPAAIGARLAPLAIGYVLSVIEAAARNRFDKIHYFTREGIFFQQVHEAIAAADPYNISYPSAELLAVSRCSTFASSLKDCSASSLSRIWSLYSEQSIQGLAISLNFDASEMEAIAESVGLDFREKIVNPGLNKKVQAFLECPQFRALAEEGISNQRRALVSYLHNKGVADGSPLMIADIGWRGTIQDNLAYLLPRSSLIGHYLGLFGFLNKQPLNVRKSGWIFDEPAGTPIGVERYRAV